MRLLSCRRPNRRAADGGLSVGEVHIMSSTQPRGTRLGGARVALQRVHGLAITARGIMRGERETTWTGHVVSLLAYIQPCSDGGTEGGKKINLKVEPAAYGRSHRRILRVATWNWGEGAHRAEKREVVRVSWKMKCCAAARMCTD